MHVPPALPVLLLLSIMLACSTPTEIQPPKRPNTELIVGDFERRPPAGEMAVRFAGDGTFRFTKNRGELERTPYLASGTYKLDGDALAFTADKGQCAEQAGDRAGEKTATYQVVVSKIGIRFKKVDDSCAERSRLDGQTLWRIK